MEEDAELSNNQSSKSFDFDDVESEQKVTKRVNGQIEKETNTEAGKVAANRSYVLGYFVEKLSDAYKDAGRRLQSTRNIIRNVGPGEVKVVLSQYVTMVSKELIPRRQINTQPQTCTRAANKVSLVDLCRDRPLSLHPNTGQSVIAGVSGRPGGAVLSIRDTTPEVFYQTLVRLPPALSRLQTSPSTKILERLESLSPQIKVRNPQSIFWLQTANRRRPVPKPGCLLLSEEDVTVVSAETDSVDNLALFHHFNLLSIKTVQIGLGGQHVRLIGRSTEDVLAVFTHSKELTQEFCRALLKALAPQTFSESHPLLSSDLMVLSLDWTSVVPDIILDSGLHITCRFKRVLADLLYIVHGNMDGPGKPSLADVCPLLYTSVKVKNSKPGHRDTVFQFLLTDTHVALLCEDGVFHPSPRGSSLVPVQPQFQGLELRKRSDIRCLVVRQNDNCLVVDVVFTSQKPKTIQRAELGSDDQDHCHSWKLIFGCTSEAVIFINHLCS